jgi:hypothetical protein
LRIRCRYGLAGTTATIASDGRAPSNAVTAIREIVVEDDDGPGQRAFGGFP